MADAVYSFTSCIEEPVLFEATKIFEQPRFPDACVLNLKKFFHSCSWLYTIAVSFLLGLDPVLPSCAAFLSTANSPSINRINIVLDGNIFFHVRSGILAISILTFLVSLLGFSVSLLNFFLFIRGFLRSRNFFGRPI
jgi:hypothetical protein